MVKQFIDDSGVDKILKAYSKMNADFEELCSIYVFDPMQFSFTDSMMEVFLKVCYTTTSCILLTKNILSGYSENEQSSR